MKSATGEASHLRHGALLALLVALLVLGPLLPTILVGAAFLFTMTLVIWLLSMRFARDRVFAIAAAAVAVALTGLDIVWSISHEAIEGHGILFRILMIVCFLLLTTWASWLILRALLHERCVSLDTIFGAVSLYLIVGLAWGGGFSLVELVAPGSFLDGQRATQAGGGKAVIDADLTYFSFVTLATLGYGDITPHSVFAGRLAVVEAIMGQFYIAVVVAYLVSAFLASKPQEATPEPTVAEPSGQEVP